MLDYGDESDDKLMSTDILEDIIDGSQSHPGVNSIDAGYKICNRIKQIQSECKRALKAAQNMVCGP